MMVRTKRLFVITIIVFSSGCAVRYPDYSAYLERFPRSVLVMPPINESLEVQASGMFLSTITQALAEFGYYVFPVAVVDQIFKDNGVPLPPEMHQVSLSKLHEVFGADAVLYITIHRWTTTYVVLDTTTTVELSYRLVDVESGTQLWTWRQIYAYSSSSQQSNLISMVVAATVQAAQSGSGRLERDVAAAANYAAFYLPHHGLIKGTRHPEHEKDLKRIRRQQERLDKHRAVAGGCPGRGGDRGRFRTAIGVSGNADKAQSMLAALNIAEAWTRNDH